MVQILIRSLPVFSSVISFQCQLNTSSWQCEKSIIRSTGSCHADQSVAQTEKCFHLDSFTLLLSFSVSQLLLHTIRPLAAQIHDPPS